MGETRVQDEQGNVHVFPEGSTPEMIAQAMNVKPPSPAWADTKNFNDPFGVINSAGTVTNDVGNPVTVPQEGESDADTIKRATSRFKSYSPQEQQSQMDKEVATMPRKVPQALGAAAGIGVAGPAALAGAGELGAAAPLLPPFIRAVAKAGTNWVKANPIKTMAAIEAAKQIPGPIGRIAAHVPSRLPMIAGSPEAEAGPSPVPPVRWGGAPEPPPTPRGGNLPVKWNPQPEPAPAPRGRELPVRWNRAPEPEPEPMQQRPQGPPPVIPKETENTLQTLLKSATGAPPPPPPVRPGVPIGQQRMTPEGHTPTPESKAIHSYKYDPATKEMHVVFNGGNGTSNVRGGVSPEQAQSFIDAPSKGQAWQELKANSVDSAKIINGQRVARKSAMKFRSADPNDHEFLNDPERWNAQKKF